MIRACNALHAKMWGCILVFEIGHGLKRVFFSSYRRDDDDDDNILSK